MPSSVCQHCGRTHAEDLERCPRTNRAMKDPGLCGTQVDRYLVEKLLGTGGFGAVYLAHHRRTRAPVALKVLKPALMADATVLERFLREATTAASVGSEHLVRVVDAEITADNLAFIAMEYLDGDDLKTIVKREGRLHPARAVELTSQVLRGLAAAHDKGIVHRDVKPANVFVTRKRDVHGRYYELAKVLDFGISKVTGAAVLTAQGVTMGTPSYMAWEQFTDAREVDARTDLYAVAAMLHELLLGAVPFDAEHIAALMNKLRIGDRRPLRDLAPWLPVPLSAIVEKGLEKRRERRWQSAREFLTALENVVVLLDAAPPLAPPTLEMEEVDLERQRITKLRVDASNDETIKE